MTILGEGLLSHYFGTSGRWPNPHDSTGVQLAILKRNKYCWEAIGPARAVFINLQDEIGQYIEQTSESLSQDVVWSLYMVGRSRETSKPSITFVSSEAGPRQKLRKLIKESCLLGKHPGFITMDMDRPPGCKSGVIKPLGESEEGQPACNLTSDSYQIQQIFLSSSSNNLAGTAIYLNGSDSNLVATGGGLVQFNGNVYLTSVAHPFDKSWPNIFPETTAEAGYVFDIDEFSDTGDEDEAIMDETSRGSITSNSHSNTSHVSLDCEGDSPPSTQNLQAPISPRIQESVFNISPTAAPLHEFNTANLTDSQNCDGDVDDSNNDGGSSCDDNNDAEANCQIPKWEGSQTSRAASNYAEGETLYPTFMSCGPTISSVDGDRPALDYSLFKLPDLVLKTSNITATGDLAHAHSRSVPREPRSTEIVVCTASGTVPGRLLATPSFIQGTRGSSRHQLWTVLVDGTLQKGICGSWVVEALSGDVFGHIIAGAPEDGFAYITPFYEILDDLNHRFEGGWALAVCSTRVTEISGGDPTTTSRLGDYMSSQDVRQIKGSSRLDFDMTSADMGLENLVQKGDGGTAGEDITKQNKIGTADTFEPYFDWQAKAKWPLTGTIERSPACLSILEKTLQKQIPADLLRRLLKDVCERSEAAIFTNLIRSNTMIVDAIRLCIGMENFSRILRHVKSDYGPSLPRTSNSEELLRSVARQSLGSSVEYSHSQSFGLRFGGSADASFDGPHAFHARYDKQISEREADGDQLYNNLAHDFFSQLNKCLPGSRAARIRHKNAIFPKGTHRSSSNLEWMGSNINQTYQSYVQEDTSNDDLDRSIWAERSSYSKEITSESPKSRAQNASIPLGKLWIEGSLFAVENTYMQALAVQQYYQEMLGNLEKRDRQALAGNKTASTQGQPQLPVGLNIFAKAAIAKQGKYGEAGIKNWQLLARAGLLLENHAEEDFKSLDNGILLSWAVRCEHEEVVKLLLEQDVQIEIPDGLYGRTPLSWAAENERDTIAKLLLKKGADIDCQSRYERTPLSWAAENGNDVMVKLLLQEGAYCFSESRQGRIPLSWAAARGHDTIVKLLLNHSPITDDWSTDERTPLSWAAENGHDTVVKLLLNNGANMAASSIDRRTPLSWAAENGHDTIVKLLLNNGADIESSGIDRRTPLSWAAERGHDTIVSLLLEKYADIESSSVDRRTPLSWAAEEGHATIVELLLRRGAYPDSRSLYGRTPLSWAAERGHDTIVRLLLSKGADIEFSCIDGRTPFLWAQWAGQHQVAKLLSEFRESHLGTKGS